MVTGGTFLTVSRKESRKVERCRRGAVFGIESTGNYRLTVILRVGERSPDSTFLSVKARFFADFELVVDHSTNQFPSTIFDIGRPTGRLLGAAFPVWAINRLMRLHPETFCREFTLAFRQPPKSFLQKELAMKAAYLLRKQNYRVKEVAAVLDFPSGFYFPDSSNVSPGFYRIQGRKSALAGRSGAP